MYMWSTLCCIGIVIPIIMAIIYCISRIPTKKEDKLNKQKIIIIILLLIGIILPTYFWCSYNFHYEVNIERSYITNAEKEAIQKAEELDMAAILNISRYYDDSKQTNNPSTEPTAYVWPNIVDKITLNFYQSKIEKLRSNLVPVNARLEYNAEGKEYSNISIFYNRTTQRIIINEDTYSIEITEAPSSDLYHNCAIYINNSLEIITKETQSAQINLSNGYVVTQDFYYWEQYDLLAGFGGGAEQIIVLEQNYLPILILSRGKGYGIS